MVSCKYKTKMASNPFLTSALHAQQRFPQHQVGHGMRPFPPTSFPETGKNSSSSSNPTSGSTKQRPQHVGSGMPPPYGGMRPGMHHGMADSRKRHAQQQQQQLDAQKKSQSARKKRRMADKVLPLQIRQLVPESQAYMDLLAFERKLDSTIMRKRLDIQEALKRPMKQKRKLRVFISNTYYPGKPDADEKDESSIPSWELRVEGRPLDDPLAPKYETKQKRKFSSFFKSLVIELDKDLYGPDNHLVEWHRTSATNETDGFQVKRPGSENVKCTLLLLLDHQPPQYKLDPRLARLLGVHTQTRPVIITALWQYIKTHRLQDPHEREYINNDNYFQQINSGYQFCHDFTALAFLTEFHCIVFHLARKFLCLQLQDVVRKKIFECPRMKFSEIPQRLHPLLHAPDPIVIHHVINVDSNDQKKTACYDIDVEVDDTLKEQMKSFLLSTTSQQEIATLDNKIHETVETINQLKIQREFMLGFARDPQQFISEFLVSQSQDLRTMKDVVGNPEDERHADFYHQQWTQEAVRRYFYAKVQQRRAELEQALGMRTT